MIRKSGKNWEKYFILEKKYSRVYFKCFYLCFTKEKEERVVNKLQLFPLFLSGATSNRKSVCIALFLNKLYLYHDVSPLNKVFTTLHRSTSVYFLGTISVCKDNNIFYI